MRVLAKEFNAEGMTGLKDPGDSPAAWDAGYPEPSSTFTWWLGDVYWSKFGPSRSPQLNPFKSFVSKSVIWANGSDFPVVPFPARYGIWATAAREPLLGAYAKDPFGRKESVAVRAALRSHTIWAAHQMFHHKQIVYRAPNSPIQAPN